MRNDDRQETNRDSSPDPNLASTVSYVELMVAIVTFQFEVWHNVAKRFINSIYMFYKWSLAEPHSTEGNTGAVVGQLPARSHGPQQGTYKVENNEFNNAVFKSLQTVGRPLLTACCSLYVPVD